MRDDQKAVSPVRRRKSRTQIGSVLRASSAHPIRKVKEKAIENEILSFLKRKGIFCFKVESQGTYDARLGIYRRKNSVHRLLGVADICGLLPSGRFFACEVKSATGRLSEHQVEFLKNVNDNNGIGFMARSIEDVAHHLSL
jgi:penicillin-binding protein-related factor A (putative recombinase)